MSSNCKTRLNCSGFISIILQHLRKDMHFQKVKVVFNKQVTLEDFSCHSLIVPVKKKGN